MEKFSSGSVTLVLATLGIMMFLISFGVIIYRYFSKKSASFQPNAAFNTRNKYPEVDVFRHSGIFFKIGLAVALGLVTLAFSWTHYGKKVHVLADFENIEEIEIEIPRTAEPTPPSPPSLPPTVVKIVPNEILNEDEQPDFVDVFFREDLPVEAPAQVKREVPATPPPLPKAAESDEPFIIVEEMPRFPGCDNLSTRQEKNDCTNKKLLEFIYKNINYPPMAAENGIQGTVPVKFVVEKDGTIANAQVLRDIGGGCGQEALRVIELINKENIKWKPGMQGGRPVRVQFNLPVKFKLQ